ncbi:MAG: response regulator [Betaproteobacteria bacterium]|nr:response regulator [Betaproteobacteria bacterium]
MTQARPRLLIVDDDRVVLSTMLAGLSRAGFDVVVATNGDEATRVAVDARPALAIIDVDMEGHKGLEVAETLARETRTPLLLLAKPRDEPAHGRGATIGALGVIAKPVDMARLVPAIRAALARVEAASRTGTGIGLLGDTLEGKNGPQALIAIGILVERHKVNCDEAVRLLEQRAIAGGLPVEEVALTVIEQAESVTRPSV